MLTRTFRLEFQRIDNSSLRYSLLPLPFQLTLKGLTLAKTMRAGEALSLQESEQVLEKVDAVASGIFQGMAGRVVCLINDGMAAGWLATQPRGRPPIPVAGSNRDDLARELARMLAAQVQAELLRFDILINGVSYQEFDRPAQDLAPTPTVAAPQIADTPLN